MRVQLLSSCLLALLALGVAPRAMGKGTTPCLEPRSLPPGYLTGRGEGPSFDVAKREALVDLLSFFETRITAAGQSRQTATGPIEFIETVEAKVDGEVKGAEVLSECRDQNTVHITVGLKRSVMASLLQERGEARAAWLRAAVASMAGTEVTAARRVLAAKLGRELTEIEAQARADREKWLLIGRAASEAPALDEEAVATLRRGLLIANQPPASAVVVEADGVLAEATRLAFVRLLEARGFRVAPSHAAGGWVVTWQCQATKGAPVGATVRFQIVCRANDDRLGLEPVAVNGIASRDEVDQIMIDRIAAALASIK